MVEYQYFHVDHIDNIDNIDKIDNIDNMNYHYSTWLLTMYIMLDYQDHQYDHLSQRLPSIVHDQNKKHVAFSSNIKVP